MSFEQIYQQDYLENILSFSGIPRYRQVSTLFRDVSDMLEPQMIERLNRLYPMTHEISEDTIAIFHISRAVIEGNVDDILALIMNTIHLSGVFNALLQLLHENKMFSLGDRIYRLYRNQEKTVLYESPGRFFFARRAGDVASLQDISNTYESTYPSFHNMDPEKIAFARELFPGLTNTELFPLLIDKYGRLIFQEDIWYRDVEYGIVFEMNEWLAFGGATREFIDITANMIKTQYGTLTTEWFRDDGDFKVDPLVIWYHPEILDMNVLSDYQEWKETLNPNRDKYHDIYMPEHQVVLDMLLDNNSQ